MNISAKKTMITRLAAIVIAAFIMAIVFAFNTFTTKASAADTTVQLVDTVDTAAENSGGTFYVDGIEFNAVPEAVSLSDGQNSFEVVQLAAGGGGGGSLNTNTEGDDTFESVIRFFIKWIKRIGLVVAFVGGVMFALAIKNNDAEQKQAGLLTLIAGFVVAALCQAVDMFNIFE